MKRPKLTILVPIYNVEAYLRQALDSLINQTFPDLEILCLDDGSTDGSPAILKEYAKKDSRLKVITKPNSGYGDSMNQGLAAARGEYIGILEPDDYLEPDAFERLLRLANRWHADVVKANYYREQNQIPTKVTEIKLRDTARPLNPQRDRQVFTFGPAIWSAIYRRAFLEQRQINFLPTPGASYQDLSFSLKVWLCAETIILTDAAYVHYRVDNQNSSINSPGKVQCVVDEYAEVSRFLNQHPEKATFRPDIEAARFRNYHWNFQRLSPDLARQFYYDTLLPALQSAHAQNLLRRTNFSLPHWLTIRLILKSPNLAYKVLRSRVDMLK